MSTPPASFRRRVSISQPTARCSRTARVSSRSAVRPRSPCSYKERRSPQDCWPHWPARLSKDSNQMESLDQIWRDYRSGLLSFIRRRIDSADLAEDILQDVFVKAHSRMDT